MEQVLAADGRPGELELFASVFRALPAPAAIVTFEGRIRRVNRVCAELFEYDASELVDRPLSEFIDLNASSRLAALRRRLGVRRTMRDLPVPVQDGNGRLRAMSWDLSLLDSRHFLASGRESCSGNDLNHCCPPGPVSECRLLAQVFDLVFEVSGDRLAEINPEGAALLGAESPEALCCFPLDSLFHPLDLPRVRGVFQRVAAGQPVTGPTDVRLITLDGRVLEGAMGPVLVRNVGGRQVIQAAIRDQSEQQRARAALRAGEDYFETLATVAPVGIFEAGPEGDVVYANRRCAEILGLGQQTVLGTRWQRAVHPDDLDRVLEEWFGMVFELRPFRVEYRCCLPGGEVAWVLAQATALRDDDEQVTGFIGTMTDITDFIQMADKLADAEDRAQRVVEMAFDLVVLQCDHIIVDINDRGARMLGADSPDQLIGRRITELFTPAYHEVVLERIRGAMERWLPTPLTQRKLCRLDGSEIEVEGTAIPIMYKGRRATYAVYRDISARKRQERMLRNREHQFQVLAKAAPVGIFMTDPEGDCSYVNERFLEITGYGYRDTLGAAWHRQVSDQDRESVMRRWSETLGSGLPFSQEYRICRPDGREIWVLGQAVAERDAGGNVVGLVGSITDISAGKANEEQLRRYHDELELMVAERTRELARANQELETFSYSVSHDLRAPLRAINGFISALWEEYSERLDDDARRYVQRVRSNSKHMANLIDDLLELSRVGKAEFQPVPVDLTALANGVVEQLRAAEPERRVSVAIEDGLEAQGDRQMLGCLVQNLINNAWKYTGREPEARIEVGRTELSNGPVFYVRDNGVGFDEQFADQLFRPFHRLHQASEFEGTGVGLATVRRIIERHGGRIWASGGEGQGATFWFAL